MSLRPLADRVIIERTVEDQTTDSGIVISVNTQEATNQGKVIAAGKDVSLVKVGDLVIFESAAGQEVKSRDSEYLVMLEENIIGVLED